MHFDGVASDHSYLRIVARVYELARLAVIAERAVPEPAPQAASVVLQSTFVLPPHLFYIFQPQNHTKHLPLLPGHT